MKRKFLKCMIGAVMAMSIIANGSSEQAGNDIKVVQAADSEIKTITIEGFVIEYESINKGGTIVGYSGMIPEELVIPDQVVISTENGKRSLPIFKIGKEAFAKTKIKKLILNNVLNIIEDRAFYACTELEEIESTKCSIKEIGEEAFYNCISLSRVDFLRRCEDAGINTILNKRTFGNCIGLSSLNLATHDYSADDIKSIFSGCYRLWSIHIQNKKVEVDIEPEYQKSVTGPVVKINGEVVDTSKKITIQDNAKVEFSDDSKIVLVIYDGEYSKNTENKAVMQMLVNTKKKHTYLAYDDDGNVSILNFTLVDANGNYTEEVSTETVTRAPVTAQSTTEKQTVAATTIEQTTEKITENLVTTELTTEQVTTQKGTTEQSVTEKITTEQRAAEGTSNEITTEQKTEGATTEQSASSISRPKLSQVKIISVKNVKGKKAQLKFKKASNGKYQIKISTSKKFKRKLTKTYTTRKTAYTIKQLKQGQTYYVKVRAYAKGSSTQQDLKDKIYYGKWSTIKKIKISK